MEKGIKLEEKTEMIRTIATVKKIGDSMYIHLDKKIKADLHIENGIVLGVKLWNIETVTIKCNKCSCEFESYKNADPHDCPECGEEILNINVQIVETNNTQTKGGDVHD